MPYYNVRAAPLGNIPPLLSALGVDPAQVMESAGFNAGELATAETHVPYAKAAVLIDAAAKASRCDTFGLMLGQGFSIQQLGIVGELALTSGTVESALQSVIDNFHLHDSGGIVTLNRDSSLAWLSYMPIAPKRVSVAQVNEMCVACLCLFMRSLCGPDWSPARVELTRAAPVADACYTDFFRAPIVFGAKQNTLSFSRRWLDLPLTSSDIEGHRTLVAMAQDLPGSNVPRLAMVVRRLLHQRLSAGSSASCEIAEALGIHERSLRRRLRQENSSFSKLLEEVRQTMSFQYLSDTGLAIGDIAVLLGYGSTDAFDHAFRRWYGVSPLQWRNLNQVRCGTGDAEQLESA
jgi:AraC-like DNA-binding protein